MGFGMWMLRESGMMTPTGQQAVCRLAGFTPGPGDRFDMLNFGSLGGTFHTLRLPALPAGLAWDGSALYQDGSLSIAAVPEPATTGLVWGGMLCYFFFCSRGRQ